MNFLLLSKFTSGLGLSRASDSAWTVWRCSGEERPLRAPQSTQAPALGKFSKVQTRQLHLLLLVDELHGAGELREFMPSSLLDSGDGGAAAWLPWHTEMCRGCNWSANLGGNR